GVDGTRIAIAANTSAAASIVASGFDWKPGDEALLCDNEFPANAVPWMALRTRGVHVRLLKTERERLTPELLRRAISPRTRLVAVSWVSYADGYRHDLAGLAQAAHEAGAFLCVDAMQGLGAFTLDASQTGVDAVYAGAAKWLLGLHGVALLYIGERLDAHVQLMNPGWRSVENMWDFHNHAQGFSQDAMRFESGTPNLIGTLSLVSAIELFERSGKEKIAQHVLALTDRLCDGLRRLGAEIRSPRGNGVSSGIVTFALPGCDTMALGRALEDERIITTYRAGTIRVSPHGYNTDSEIDILLETLNDIAKRPVAVS
ncbi:MAG: aminotransferase class V-fold PLP-dependent enzyme, partial [Candidatus Eremiobacteraeota bacterium]|nr:aminotransferase class V-fold PLP-dependent enzyme [Candidatus Eremiobacteraeota bacterium]